MGAAAAFGNWLRRINGKTFGTGRGVATFATMTVFRTVGIPLKTFRLESDGAGGGGGTSSGLASGAGTSGMGKASTGGSGGKGATGALGGMGRVMAFARAISALCAAICALACIAPARACAAIWSGLMSSIARRATSALAR